MVTSMAIALPIVPDPVRYERTGAAALLTIDRPERRNAVDGPTADALAAWCRARLADYKAPDEVVFLAALPLTSMLKVDKAALATLRRDGRRAQ